MWMLAEEEVMVVLRKYQTHTKKSLGDVNAHVPNWSKKALDRKIEKQFLKIMGKTKTDFSL